ncbi:MAG: hypothetical protein ACI88A_000100 [Paraglaciecola sp.]|jgi:hypothetical protein
MNCKGFSFVEVLVTSLIIMLSVGGYTSLQAQYMRSDANLHLRYLALQLGQEKLDDLRQFTRLTGTPGEQAFNDIADNAGGTLSAGEVEVTLNTEQQNFHKFSRNWLVSDEYYVDSDNDGISDSWVKAGAVNLPNPLPAHAALKIVKVTVAWLDRGEKSHSIYLASSIAPIKLGHSYQAKSESINVKSSPQ